MSVVPHPEWSVIAIVVFGITGTVGYNALDACLKRAHPERYLEVWGDGPLGLREVCSFRRYVYSSDDDDDPIIHRWRMVARIGELGTYASMVIAAIIVPLIARVALSG